jgi:hypothetical protein
LVLLTLKYIYVCIYIRKCSFFNSDCNHRSCWAELKREYDQVRKGCVWDVLWMLQIGFYSIIQIGFLALIWFNLSLITYL